MRSYKSNLSFYLVLLFLAFWGYVTDSFLRPRWGAFSRGKIIEEKNTSIKRSWDKDLCDLVIKLLLPKWQEDILDQERIVERSQDNPDKVIQAYLTMAQIYENKDKYIKVKKACDYILKNYPEHPLRKQVYLRQISIYEKEQNYTKIRELSEFLIQEFPDDSAAVQAELTTIVTYENEGNYQKAVQGYEQFLAKYPNFKDADYLFFKTGLLYKKMGKWADAYRIFQSLSNKESTWAEKSKSEIWLYTKEGTKPFSIVSAKKISILPCLDGLANDTCWKQARWVSDFLNYATGKSAKEITLAALCYDDKNLYVFFQCYDSNTGDLETKAAKKDDAVYNDDEIELFLDTDHDYKTYFQLIVNSAGTQFDSEGTNHSWNCDFEAVSRVDNNNWCVELSIPFKELKASVPEKGEVWGVNLCRHEITNSEWSSWCYSPEGFHTPYRFGYLVFE